LQWANLDLLRRGDQNIYNFVKNGDTDSHALLPTSEQKARKHYPKLRCELLVPFWDPKKVLGSRKTPRVPTSKNI
jgi:hypothetical protein